MYWGLTLPVGGWWKYGWVLDLGVDKIQANPPLTNPARLSTVLAVGETLVTLNFVRTFVYKNHKASG